MSAVGREPSGRPDVRADAGEESRGAAIRGAIRRPFAAVPFDILADGRITLSDRAVLTIMLALLARPNWTLRVKHVMHLTGLSAGGWKACRRRLEAAGYYSAKRVREADGHWRWSLVVTDTPGSLRDEDHDENVKSTIHQAVMDGGVIDRGEVDIRRSTLHSSTLRKRAEAPRAPARVGAPPEAAGAAAAGEKKRRGPLRRNGVTCWNDADLVWTEDLTSEAGADAVRAAARASRDAGEDPVPSAVEKRLRQDAAVRARKEAEQAAVEAEAAKAKAKAKAEAEREARRDNPTTQAAAARALAAAMRALR